MERMPTPNVTRSDALYAFHLPVTTFLGFALSICKTQFSEQRFRLLGVQLQRYVSSLHTFLLYSYRGIQRTGIVT
jgi:hypothetical protein